MGWEKSSSSPKNNQASLFVDLSAEEQIIFDQLKNGEAKALDNISLSVKFPMSKTAATLLILEFKGVVRSLPGKMYQRI